MLSYLPRNFKLKVIGIAILFLILNAFIGQSINTSSSEAVQFYEYALPIIEILSFFQLIRKIKFYKNME